MFIICHHGVVVAGTVVKLVMTTSLRQITTHRDLVDVSDGWNGRERVVGLREDRVVVVHIDNGNFQVDRTFLERERATKL